MSSSERYLKNKNSELFIETIRAYSPGIPDAPQKLHTWDAVTFVPEKTTFERYE